MLQIKLLFPFLVSCIFLNDVSSQIAIPQTNNYGIQRRQFWSPPLPPLDGPLGNRGHYRHIPVNNALNTRAIPNEYNQRNEETRPYGLPAKKTPTQPPIPPIPHILPIPFPITPDPSLIPRGILQQQSCHGPHCDHQGNGRIKVWKRRFFYPETRRNEERIPPFQPLGSNRNRGGEAYGVNYEYGYETPQL